MFDIDAYLNAKRLGLRHAGKAASPKTLTAYAWALKRVESLLGKPLSAMAEQDAEILLTVMDSEGFSTATRAQIVAACRGVFDWAIATGRYHHGHPFNGISAPTVNRALPTILTKEQIECFFGSFESEKYQLFFSLMYYGGLRIGEVRTLLRRNVRHDHLVIDGKGGKQRIVPIPESILAKLRAYMSENDESIYVFYAQANNAKDVNEPMSLYQAYALFHKAKEVCGLPKELHPHNLRHTSATHLQKDVRDITITQRFLGHSRPETTMRYAQIADEDVRIAHSKTFGA